MKLFEIRNCTGHWEKQCMAMCSSAFWVKRVGKDKIAETCQVLISPLPAKINTDLETIIGYQKEK
jgi:hypothetical protein